MQNRRIAFRLSKEFTEEQLLEMKAHFGYNDESDTIRKLLQLGYNQIKHKAENLEKAKKMIEALGLSSKDLELAKV